MTPKERAAMQQALEALESAPVQYDFNSYPMLVMTPDTLQTTLTALREALAEPDIEEMTLTQIAARHEQAEQEPVAWRCIYNHAAIRLIEPEEFFKRSWEPLFTAAPVRTKDLTDEEQLELARSSVGKSRHWLVAAVIAAHKEKNK